MLRRRRGTWVEPHGCAAFVVGPTSTMSKELAAVALAWVRGEVVTSDHPTVSNPTYFPRTARGNSGRCACEDREAMLSRCVDCDVREALAATG